MPSIGSRGAISARSLGFSGGSVLTVYSFPTGTNTFTVPAGVTKLEGVAGRGQNGTAGGWSSFTYVGTAWATGYPSGSTGTNSITWQSLYNRIVSHQNTVNSSGSGDRTIAIPNYNFQLYENASSNLGYVYISESTFRVRGSATILYVNSPPSSGTVTIASLGGTYKTKGYSLYGLEKYTDPTTGANTTGFGLTFPGGVGGSATTSLYTNVSVVPGDTYTIVNNGSLTISYY